MNTNSRIRISLVFHILMALAACAWAQEKEHIIKIDRSVDRDVITIGDRITYRISISYPERLTLEDPDPARDLSEFEIKDYKLTAPKKKKGRISKGYEYILTTFTTGYYVIPPIYIQGAEDDGKKYQARSSSIPITVESISAGMAQIPEDILPIKPPVSWRGSRYMPWLIISAVIGAAGGILLYAYKKKKRAEDFFSNPDRYIPPGQLALERLDKLKNSSYLEAGKIKEFYIILAEIIRRYLEDQFSIPVLDKTTNELFILMKDSSIKRSDAGDIRDFLARCDLVKFAKYRPEDTETKMNMETAHEIISRTKTAETDTGEAADT